MHFKSGCRTRLPASTDGGQYNTCISGANGQFSFPTKSKEFSTNEQNSIRTVGIIGSGPSGATLASLLTMKGVEVTLFDDGRRPDLIVGESLIPAVVPVLRKLGLEERAAAICQQKPGVTFTFGADEKVEFCFPIARPLRRADLRL